MTKNLSGYLLFCLMILNTGSYAQERVIDSLKKVIESASEADTNQIKAINNLALEYLKADNSAQAKAYSKKAIALSQKLKYPKGEALAYRRLSTLYMLENANPMALEYLNKAYKLYKSENDSLNCARVLTNIGLYYHEIKDYAPAFDFFSQALQEAEKLGRPSLQIVLYNNIGDIYERWGKLEKAQIHFGKALSLALKEEESGYLAFCYSNLASVHYKKKKYSAALGYCDKALATSIENPDDLAGIYLIQARVNFALKNYNLSRKILKKSDSITRQTRNLDNKLQIYHEYYVLDSVENNYRSALLNFTRYHRLQDSLVNVNKSRIVALYHVKFALQKREDENRLLRISQEKNQAIISKQHTMQAGLLIGLFLIGGGLIYLKRIYNQIESKNKFIEKQNLILENSNLVKDKLFSVISHDLRSPIAHVVSVFDLWQSGAMDAKDMSAITPIIKGYIINTLELLDNLLIWSKNQLQGFKFNPEFFNLHTLITENTRALESHILQKNLIIKILADAHIELYADREMVKIVLRNLLSNAIKFTPQKGTININSYAENEHLIITVQDTGIGIKETDKEKIFAFNSHTTLGTSNEKGTGLGLRLCREFIDINKGKIWMESKEGKGSTFYIAFPLINSIKQAV